MNFKKYFCALRYHLFVLLYIVIILLIIKLRGNSQQLNPENYNSEGGFNYIEDVDVFK